MLIVKLFIRKCVCRIKCNLIIIIYFLNRYVSSCYFGYFWFSFCCCCCCCSIVRLFGWSVASVITCIMRNFSDATISYTPFVCHWFHNGISIASVCCMGHLFESSPENCNTKNHIWFVQISNWHRHTVFSHQHKSYFLWFTFRAVNTFTLSKYSTSNMYNSSYNKIEPHN